MFQRTLRHIRTVSHAASAAIASTVVVAALAASAPAAYAATVSSGTFKWNELSIERSSGDVEFIPVTGTSESSLAGLGATVPGAFAATATPDGRPLSEDWSEVINRSESFPGSGSSFLLGPDDVVAESQATGGTAAAYLVRQGFFSVVGSGTIDISLPYEYDLGADPGGQSEVSFRLEGDGMVGPPMPIRFFADEDTVADSGMGTLAVQLNITDAFSVFGFEADITSSVAAVPVPAAWLLFGSALLVLRRRACRK